MSGRGILSTRGVKCVPGVPLLGPEEGHSSTGVLVLAWAAGGRAGRGHCAEAPWSGAAVTG